MPIKPYKHKPIEEKDSFRYSTPDLKVVANPRDTYVAPRASVKAERFAQLIGASAQPVIQGISAYDNAQFTTGENQSLAGGEPEEDAGSSYLKGYELQKGKARGQEYSLKAQEILNNGKDLTMGELREKLEDLHSEYITGTSQAFQLGFGPVAQNARNVLYKKHIEVIQKQVEDEYKANIGAGILGDASVVWAQYKDDPEAYASKMKEIIQYTNNTTDGKHAFSPKALISLELTALGTKAVETKNSKLLKPFLLVDDEGKSLVDDPDLRKQLAIYMTQAESLEKDDVLNTAYDAIVKRCTRGDGSIDYEKALLDVTNVKVQQELNIKGTSALTLRSQLQAAFSAERTNIIEKRAEALHTVASKAYALALKNDIAGAVKLVKSSTNLDGEQRHKLVRSLMGTETSDPIALNQLNQRIISKGVQTFDGIVATEGVAFKDKIAANELMKELQKPENSFVSFQLQKLPKLFKFFMKDCPLNEEAKVRANNAVVEDVRKWREQGEDVTKNLSTKYLLDIVDEFTPTAEETMASLTKVSLDTTIQKQLFNEHTQPFVGFVYDFFKEGNTLPGLEKRRRPSWAYLQAILKDDKAKAKLKKLYEERRVKHE
jgi:hypothetical protein